ncbi:MAG: riboflavin synthase [Kiritimatiellae bacterium]|nr:riboflavin synthase [Kiritimatiellia bacterium]
MFTGLIEKTGVLEHITPDQEGSRLCIRMSDAWTDNDPVILGESIAVNGVCLTVTATDQRSFHVDVLKQTLDVTTLGDLPTGATVNLERAMQANARFGGHMVSGHVDGVGSVNAITPLGRDHKIRITCSKAVLEGIVAKGSLTVDGISLTVAAVDDDGVDIYVIPVTWKATNMNTFTLQTQVNLETDLLGKYVQQAVRLNKL